MTFKIPGPKGWGVIEKIMYEAGILNDTLHKHGAGLVLDLYTTKIQNPKVGRAKYWFHCLHQPTQISAKKGENAVGIPRKLRASRN